MDIDALARSCGIIRWIEGALFEALGSWLADTPEPAVREYFGVECQRHAWHAELWELRQPARPDVEPDSYVVAPNATAVEFIAVLRGATSSLERLGGITRVALPRLIAGANTFLAGHDARVDAPTARVVTLVRRDHLEAWQAGEQLLQSLLHTADDVTRLSDHLARLEALAATSHRP